MSEFCRTVDDEVEYKIEKAGLGHTKCNKNKYKSYSAYELTLIYSANETARASPKSHPNYDRQDRPG